MRLKPVALHHLCATLWMGLAACGWAASPAAHAQAASAPAARPALTVTVTTPQRVDWPLRIAATGNIAAWQQVVVGAEVGGWRLVEVAAQVGDVVRRGQLLARLSTDVLNADMAQTRAGLAEAQALLAEATANADRARELQPTGVLSRQQTTQILTAEQTARARVESLKARLQADRSCVWRRRASWRRTTASSRRARRSKARSRNPGRNCFA